MKVYLKEGLDMRKRIKSKNSTDIITHPFNNRGFGIWWKEREVNILTPFDTVS
jgi:hypothetical protein